MLRELLKAELAGRTKTGRRGMILRVTHKTVELVGELAEWQTLEAQVRLGQWTSGPDEDGSNVGRVEKIDT